MILRDGELLQMFKLSLLDEMSLVSSTSVFSICHYDKKVPKRNTSILATKKGQQLQLMEGILPHLRLIV